MQQPARLEARFDVKVGAEGFFGVDAFGEIEPYESVHERCSDTRPAQRPARMREVRSRSGPAEIPTHDLAEADVPGADLETRHPERIADRRTCPLTAHGSDAAEEELLLNRQAAT